MLYAVIARDYVLGDVFSEVNIKPVLQLTP